MRSAESAQTGDHWPDAHSLYHENDAKYRRDFAKPFWQLAWPKWGFDDITFDRTAASFDNPGPVTVVIRNYRRRLGLDKGKPKHDALENRLAQAPAIIVPTITLESDANGPAHPDASSYVNKFSASYEYRIIKRGVGRNLLQ